MTPVSKTIMDGVINTVSRARNITKTVAKVIKADEKTNMCTVKYLSKDGKMLTNENVQVDLRNAQQWFPKEEELVLYETDGTNGVILSRFTEDYSTIRSETTMDSDVMADGKIGMIGGRIS